MSMNIRSKKNMSLKADLIHPHYQFTEKGLHVNFYPTHDGAIDLEESDFFHSFWLWDNRPENYPSPGQKIKTVYVENVSILSVEEYNTENAVTGINVKFSNDSDKLHSFTWYWLKRFASSSLKHRDSVISSDESTDVELSDSLEAPSIKDFLYSEVSVPGKENLALHRQLVEHGIAIINGMPTGEDGVQSFVNNCLGQNGSVPLIDNMYGRIWKLDSSYGGADKEGRANAAYSKDALLLHQDLAYFEASPGLQMLSWQQNDETVTGGFSTFLDTVPVLEEFRENYPQEFDLLQKVPATFQKCCMDRNPPVQYFYRTPHIRCSELTNEIIGLSWSPPFEGPLVLDEINKTEEQARAYYRARVLLEDAFENSPLISKRKMKAGELCIWNNKRYLHGRTEIGGEGRRLAYGGYVCLDRFLSAARAEIRTNETSWKDAEGPWMQHAFNHCF